MSDIYFTSDTHFGHRNICRGESQWNDKTRCRDFDTVHEMNKYMTEQFNKRVKPEDTVYHLGDFAFGGSKQVHEYINHLNCKNIILILGNHDMRFKKLYKERFKEIHKGPLTWFTELYGAFQMTHYPYDGMKFASTNYLHGHTHAYNGVLHDGQMDVSVEGNDYKPYHIDDILKLFGVNV